VLTQAGYDVTAGTSVLRAAGESSPQIAIVHLTDDTAETAYETIVTLRRTPDLPIVCISRTSSLQVRLGAFGHGADDVIVEPYPDEELLARLNVWVRRGLPSSSRWTIGDLIVEESTGTVESRRTVPPRHPDRVRAPSHPRPCGWGDRKPRAAIRRRMARESGQRQPARDPHRQPQKAHPTRRITPAASHPQEPRVPARRLRPPTGPMELR
jgi:CheY-like chemotaxis protein